MILHTILNLLLTFTFVSPSIQSPTPLTNRENPHKGIFICTGKDWTGICHWHEILPADRANDGVCITIKSPGRMISIGPDCGLAVKMYRKSGCHRDDQVTFPLMYPGWPNMDNWWGGANVDQLWFVATDTAPENRKYDEKQGCPKAYFGE
jgi:hypothetical protein